jgi:hypothetical protein
VKNHVMHSFNKKCLLSATVFMMSLLSLFTFSGTARAQYAASINFVDSVFTVSYGKTGDGYGFGGVGGDERTIDFTDVAGLATMSNTAVMSLRSFSDTYGYGGTAHLGTTTGAGSAVFDITGPAETSDYDVDVYVHVIGSSVVQGYGQAKGHGSNLFGFDAYGESGQRPLDPYSFYEYPSYTTPLEFKYTVTLHTALGAGYAANKVYVGMTAIATTEVGGGSTAEAITNLEVSVDRVERVP